MRTVSRAARGGLMRALALLALLVLAAPAVAAEPAAPAVEPAAPAATAPPVLDLERVVRLAVDKNPQVAAAEEALGQAEARVTQARAPYWPQLSGTFGYEHSYSDSSDSRLTTSTRSGASDQYSSGLSVTQKIYDFGRTGGTVDRRQFETDSSRQDLTAVLAEVIKQAKVAYFEVLKNQGLVGVAEKTLDSQQKHLDQAKGFYRAGARPKIDVTRAEVDVANARLGLTRARYDLRLSRVGLERVLGGPPVAGPYRLAEVSVMPPRPDKLAPLISEAIKARPETRSLQALVEAARGQLTAAGGGWWPSLDAFGDYNYASDGFPLREYWQVGAGLSWPLFSGWLTRGQVNEARAKVRQTEAQLKTQVLVVEQEVSDAFLELSAAAEQVQTARLALKQARENMDLAQGRYKTGVGDAIEYTDAQLSLTQAGNLVVQYTYGYLQAHARLERALGRAPLRPRRQAEEAEER